MSRLKKTKKKQNSVPLNHVSLVPTQQNTLQPHISPLLKDLSNCFTADLTDPSQSLCGPRFLFLNFLFFFFLLSFHICTTCHFACLPLSFLLSTVSEIDSSDPNFISTTSNLLSWALASLHLLFKHQ